MTRQNCIAGTIFGLPCLRTDPGKAAQTCVAMVQGMPPFAGSGGVVYVGEEMIAFLKDIAQALGTPVPYLRRALRRAEDFWHPYEAAPLSSGPSLPALLTGCTLVVNAADCSIQHHVVTWCDPGEVNMRFGELRCDKLVQILTCALTPHAWPLSAWHASRATGKRRVANSSSVTCCVLLNIMRQIWPWTC
jgi:hypothetical protein